MSLFSACLSLSPDPVLMPLFALSVGPYLYNFMEGSYVFVKEPRLFSFLLPWNSFLHTFGFSPEID